MRRLLKELFRIVFRVPGVGTSVGKADGRMAAVMQVPYSSAHSPPKSEYAGRNTCQRDLLFTSKRERTR